MIVSWVIIYIHLLRIPTYVKYDIAKKDMFHQFNEAIEGHTKMRV